MMRERGGGFTVQWVMVMVVVMVMNEITAIPTAVVTHQPAEANHVEDHYLDDALGDWLDNFGTYTFMVKQDLDTHAGHADEVDEDDVGEGEQDVDIDTAIDEVEEGEAVREEVEEEWSAPIAVSTGANSLLDPRKDYLVTVESLVVEEGSIFLTLSKYENQTTCGVGGLTLEEEVRQAARQAAGGGVDVAQESSHHGNNHPTTFIAFGLQQEGNVTSRWIAVSDQYWWASGEMPGGSMLSITFTPPECGCLALSTYFALPVGNLTLVVGPQAYPAELQTLLCVDPLAALSDHDYDNEVEEEEEEEEEAVDYLQQPSALVASRNLSETEAETETEESPDQVTVTSRKRKLSREEKKAAKKARRREKRQRIRQAGRRQARRQGQASAGRRTGRRFNRKKNQRKRTRVWKKLHKRGRKGRRRNHQGGLHHHHHEEVNGTDSENMTQHHHHHHHHHVLNGLNASKANEQEERLVDILLQNLAAGNSTSEDEDAVGEEGEEVDVAVEVEGEGEEPQTPRQRRKNRRQHKKNMRKQKRKMYRPGVKFCCKQGVKHKKNILEVNSTSGSSPVRCNASMDVVSTFANHQFGIEEDTCSTTFTTCCVRFTEEMWEGIKAKKEARKTERKQRRKSRRKERKHRRKQERRMRKKMKKQSHGHHDQHDVGLECAGEGDTCVHAK